MGKNDNGNNGRTELVFVVDRSGSMGGLESDTIGGFNSMLSKQRTIAGECRGNDPTVRSSNRNLA